MYRLLIHVRVVHARLLERVRGERLLRSCQRAPGAAPRRVHESPVVGRLRVQVHFSPAAHLLAQLLQQRPLAALELAVQALVLLREALRALADEQLLVP